MMDEFANVKEKTNSRLRRPEAQMGAIKKAGQDYGGLAEQLSIIPDRAKKMDRQKTLSPGTASICENVMVRKNI